MDRQACTGDTVLVKSREVTGSTQTLPWWLGVEGVKTTENKKHWPRCFRVLTLIRMTKDEKGLAFFKGLLL
jgi:hypothetical protein